MMSEVVRYEIKKLHYLNFRLRKLTHKKNPGWFVRNEHEHDQLILVDPVDDEEEIRVLRLPIPN
jgi:hypothetical protein